MVVIFSKSKIKGQKPLLSLKCRIVVVKAIKTLINFINSLFQKRTGKIEMLVRRVVRGQQHRFWPSQVRGQPVRVAGNHRRRRKIHRKRRLLSSGSGDPSQRADQLHLRRRQVEGQRQHGSQWLPASVQAGKAGSSSASLWSRPWSEESDCGWFRKLVWTRIFGLLRKVIDSVLII